jgi:hypothetical protein
LPPMRRIFLAGAAVLALAASPALANDFQDLRASEPAIDRAIGAMPSGAIIGTLTRISQAAEQGRRSEDQVVALVQRLQSQLRAGLPSLDIRDRLVMAQVVRAVAIDDLLRAQGGPGTVLVPCPPDLDEWGAECHPPVERALDEIAELLELSIREGFDRFAAGNPATAMAPVPPAPPGGMDAAAFGDWLDDVLDGPGIVTGAEQIDD